MSTSRDKCGHAFEAKRLPSYTTNMFGIPITVTNSAVVTKCSSCDAEDGDVSIMHPERLMAAAAVYRCMLADRLNGSEIKFLRKAMGMSAKECGDKISTDPSTLSRWETDKQAMGQVSERLLRLTVVARLWKDAPGIDVDAEALTDLKLDGFARPTYFPQLSFVLSKYKKDELYSDMAIAA